MKRMIAAMTAACMLAIAPAFAITLGKDAAKLDGIEWIQGEPIDIESGKDTIYVVEFWATWCGPCVVSIPHLTELQKKYDEKLKDSDQRVVFVGISDEEASTVKPFVDEKGEEMQYRVAVDPDRSVYRDYMEAYEQRGIPTAFVVNSEGDIAWIGHPMGELESVIDRMLAGEYDLAAEQKLMDGDSLLREIEAAVSGNEAGDLKTKLATLMEEYGDTPPLLFQTSWLLMMHPAVEEVDSETALQLAQKAYDAQEADARDSISHMVIARALFESGDAAKAVEHQEKALEMAGDDENRQEFMKEFLNEYKNAAGADASAASAEDASEGS